MGSIRRYVRFVKPYWKRIVITIVVGILKFGIPLIMPLLLKYVVDDILLSQAAPDDKMKNLFYVMVTVFFIFTVLRWPIEYWRQYLAQSVSNTVLYDIRNRAFDHIQKLSLRYFHNHRAGEVISRVINDVEQTKSFIDTGLMNIWLDLVTLLIALGIMFSMDGWLTLVAICMFPLYGFSVKYFYSRLRHLTRVRSQALATLQAHLHERVQGIPVIKSFTLEDHEQKQFDKRNRNFLAKALEHTSWNAKTFAVVNTVTDIAPLLVIMVAGYRVIQGELTVGALVAFYAYLDRLYAPLRRLVNSSTTLTQAFASMDRVFEFMDEKYDVTDSPGAHKLPPVEGRVTFENVYFRYAEDGEDVLKGINLTVEPGETVAFVGASGGGKSSLISLIPRFYDVREGSVRVDGYDVRDVTMRSLRSQIGVVLQDNILFSDSIRENILMGNPEATEKEMVEAAKAANAHDFIIELPNGYDTEIGERGVKLSGGQKQRIAIARVFLKNPRILIFDEATSALDLESEHLIQQSLERLAHNRTTFIVAHRLSTITHADKIVLIEDGQIKEEGTHQELMNKQGAYYKLFTVQNLDGVEAASGK
ncbi:ABC transporter ATP-binding protein [Aneurinibacillus thermoaerophilus]|uniref:ATP-binding cassette, subfamily B, MsbA n=1 Tax=Aneurinibacillus thermoaerophilus TaxID=143495 RepID=A0A1G8A7T2_ANETH|nr:ABC transporter ATP-binding protein [Aneurinibacillus thermoaerophilus]MED0675445.1 ABC transporter ATP-binding protein [Aneurinibacillus thermoaerophilus]MED0678799.1 ABC transporter ATP-binding protein [Aneurinibacillus thermoaerophilus]MED0736673.1 ABC transporter ATP-binding protein [Aneurinibacillus thermoaerophilus]MED0765204.1 ABC transporter ATP-binding protein [Aneurinibacillus thermoaerophilus]SDH16926.1 ATP-binding cassette, subfamily B, MsbA [Aneurinibacillus thermoaerophilus]